MHMYMHLHKHLRSQVPGQSVSVKDLKYINVTDDGRRSM